MAQHPFCTDCGMHVFYVPRSQPEKVIVNARGLDGIGGPARFFDGRHWEEAQRKRISDVGHVSASELNGATTLKSILDRAWDRSADEECPSSCKYYSYTGTKWSGRQWPGTLPARNGSHLLGSQASSSSNHNRRSVASSDPCKRVVLNETRGRRR
jgi:hypothetical protein